MELRRYLGLIWKWAWLLVLGTALAAASSNLYSKSLTPVYQASTTLMVTQSIQQAAALGERVLIMHRGRIVESIGGARKRQLRVEELLDSFDRLRTADLVDQSAAEMVRRLYI